MAHPTADLLRRAYEAAGTGDLQPLLDALADDVTWRDSSLGPLAGEYHGKDDVLAFFGKMMEVYAGTLRLDVQAILADDVRGVVLTRERILWIRSSALSQSSALACSEFTSSPSSSMCRDQFRR